MRLSPSSPTDTCAGWLREWDYAHRGLHGAGLPENSLPAFEAAIARGMGIECDVQRSRDGRAMVFHDWELDRLTGESGPTMGRSAAELERVALLGAAATIPTLETALDAIAGRVPLLVEIKSREGTAVIPLCLAVRRALEGYRGHAAVMSFDPRVGRWFAKHSPHTVSGLVMTEERDKGLRGSIRRHLALRHAKSDFLAYDIRDLPNRFAAAQRRRGLPLLTWTVRSPELRARAAEHADAPIAEGEGLA